MLCLIPAPHAAKRRSRVDLTWEGGAPRLSAPREGTRKPGARRHRHKDWPCTQTHTLTDSSSTGPPACHEHEHRAASCPCDGGGPLSTFQPSLRPPDGWPSASTHRHGEQRLTNRAAAACTDVLRLPTRAPLHGGLVLFVELFHADSSQRAGWMAAARATRTPAGRCMHAPQATSTRKSFLRVGCGRTMD